MHWSSVAGAHKDHIIGTRIFLLKMVSRRSNGDDDRSVDGIAKMVEEIGDQISQFSLRIIS